MNRHAILVLMVGGLCLALVAARMGTVRTTDGRNISGQVTEADDEVTVSSRGIVYTMSREEVAGIYYGDIEEQYRARIAEIPAGAGARAHIELATWLMRQQALDLALTEADIALRKEPDNSEARLMLQSIQRAIVLERQRGQAVEPRRPAQPDPQQQPDRRPTLNEDQINRIRQAEMRRDEPNLRLRLEGDVRRQFVEAQGLDHRAFAALTENQRGLAILQRGTPQMRELVRVLNDPVPLMDYRQRIQPIVLAGCATSGCHGGDGAAGLALFAPAASDAEAYTNFYALTQYRRTIDGVERRAIDRLRPHSSLIVQMGLPRERAAIPHPDVPNFRPVFRDADARYQQVINWIGATLLPVEPAYGIELPGIVPAEPPLPPPDAQPEPDAPPPDAPPVDEPTADPPGDGEPPPGAPMEPAQPDQVPPVEAQPGEADEVELDD